jgi:4-hydroxy-4-methyl-2-oxoglutarate aldolase
MTLTTEQRTRLTGLHSAIINDVTDEMGIDDNLIPCKRIRALWSREPVVGTAHTAQFVEIGYEETRPDDPRDELSLHYLDAIEEGDFVVEAAPETKAGLWGELLSTIAQENGATGALVDGATRDSRLIESHGFPVWSEGHSNVESFGRVSMREYDVPVEIEGVTIEPGDVVFADYESIAIVSPDIVDEVIERGEEEMAIEDDVRADIRDGKSVFDVWNEYETL